LLPRFVTAAPADKSELVSIGDGVGGGVGGGRGAICARAGSVAAATASSMPKTVATAPASVRPVPVFFARKGRDKQRINAISRRRFNSAKV
jgi:hypothetical protein